MDWKNLKEKTQWLIEKSKPIVNKAKEYGSSAIAFAGKQIEQTPIFIKNEEDYNIHMSAKRAIFVAYDQKWNASEFVRMMIPVWWTQAWTDAAEIKYLETDTHKELAEILNIQWPVEMRVYYSWTEYARHNSLDEIKKWWKDRNYKKDDVPVTPVNDPLGQAL